MSNTENAPATEPNSSTVTSSNVARKNPTQGRPKPNYSKTSLRVDRNRHGIRRETILGLSKPTKRPKKV
jgi:hypothetical protein